GVIALSSGESKVRTVENSVLHLNLENVVIVEQGVEDELAIPTFGSFGNVPTIGLDQLKRAIKTARTDDNIKGIYLQAGGVAAGQSMLSELRDELQAFKDAGKFIVSYSEVLTEMGYYLSSVADEIYLNPLGAIRSEEHTSELQSRE